MSFLVHSPIMLARSTREAWKGVGGLFARQDRTLEELTNLYVEGRETYEFFLNLGNSKLELFEFSDQLHVYNNAPGVVCKLLTPPATREHFGDLMAPQTATTQFIWTKEQGRAGNNKLRIPTTGIDLEAIAYWEDHIEGQEYRVVTVGDNRVQQFRRTGSDRRRRYEWLPMKELPKPVKDVVKEATTRLPRGSMVAWDIVSAYDPLMNTGASAFILEGNTCPGVSRYTAERVVTEIRKQRNAS